MSSSLKGKVLGVACLFRGSQHRDAEIRPDKNYRMQCADALPDFLFKKI
jgi:hypothetical protein